MKQQRLEYLRNQQKAWRKQQVAKKRSQGGVSKKHITELDMSTMPSLWGSEEEMRSEEDSPRTPQEKVNIWSKLRMQKEAKVKDGSDLNQAANIRRSSSGYALASSPSKRKSQGIRASTLHFPVEMGTERLEDFEDEKLDQFPYPEQRAKSQEPKMSMFEQAVCLARKHNFPLAAVREKLTEYRALDTDGNGTLSIWELQEAIRVRCQLDTSDEVSPHLLYNHMQSADGDGDGCINFEEYLVWSMQTTFLEEMLITDPEERQFRHFIRERGMNMWDVDHVRAIFDSFDDDKSNSIELDEFKNIMAKLMHVKAVSDIPQPEMKRYWRDADPQMSGHLSFKEFLIWYVKFTDPKDTDHHDASKKSPDPGASRFNSRASIALRQDNFKGWDD